MLKILFLLLFSSIIFGEKMSLNKKNVLGTQLKQCCTSPMTGYYRNGYCHTGPTDHGTHIVCASMTKEFLEFTKSRGNDLSTPKLNFQFPGLKPGDKWCLCALRWMEAYQSGVAPKINLESTESHMLDFINLKSLNDYSATKK
jgi:uncharacterized protein (DUF2237 family)